MTSSLTEDLELDNELEAFALDVAEGLVDLGSAIDVPTPPIERVTAHRRRPRRRTGPRRARVVVGIAASLAILAGGAATVVRHRTPADVAVTTGSDPTSVAGVPSTTAAPNVMGWHVGLDPATGFRVTSASDPCCDAAIMPTPGGRSQVAFARTDDPFGGPLLLVESDLEPTNPSPGAAPTHPSATTTLQTGLGTVPAWSWTMPTDVEMFGFQIDQQRTAKVRAIGFTREAAEAAVRDLTFDQLGRPQLATPPGMARQADDEPLSDASFATYSDVVAPAAVGREVIVQVTHRISGPHLLELDGFFDPAVSASTSMPPERIDVDGHQGLLRREGDGNAVLALYQPDQQRTIVFKSQWGVGGNELVALARRLQGVDQQAWDAAVERCGRDAGTGRC